MTRTVRRAHAHEPLDAQRTKPTTRIELIATAALALSTIVALTAVSIGIARAEPFGSNADPASGPVVLALAVGLLLSAMGGLRAILAVGPSHRE